MDHGQILAQTPHPGLDLPNRGILTVEELTKILAPVGANMLVQGLRDRLFVPPIKAIAPSTESPMRHASKIAPGDRHVDWSNWTAEEILRRDRVIGPLWSTAVGPPTLSKKQRVVWSSGFEVSPTQLDGSPGVGHVLPGDPNLYIRTIDGETLVAQSMTVEGFEKKAAGQISMRAGLVDPKDEEKNESVKTGPLRFHNPFI